MAYYEKITKKVVIDFNEISEVIGDIIGDYLSDTYGFCHYGFAYEIKGDKTDQVLNYIQRHKYSLDKGELGA